MIPERTTYNFGPIWVGGVVIAVPVALYITFDRWMALSGLLVVLVAVAYFRGRFDMRADYMAGASDALTMTSGVRRLQADTLSDHLSYMDQRQRLAENTLDNAIRASDRMTKMLEDGRRK